MIIDITKRVVMTVLFMDNGLIGYFSAYRFLTNLNFQKYVAFGGLNKNGKMDG